MTIAQSRGSPRAVTDGDTVLATATVAASPERVFRALNTVEVETWWGSADTYRIRNWKADFRIGGRWSVDVMMADGKSNPACGVFLEIDAPHKIVFTRRYDWDYPLLGWRDTTVTYLVKHAAADACVVIRQDGFAGLGHGAEHHVEGWERFLGFLKAYLSRADISDQESGNGHRA